MTDLDLISPEAVEITLTNGTVIKIKYDMTALAEIERKHGSLSKMAEEVQGGQFLNTLAHALWAGSPMFTKVPLPAFLALLDPARIRTEYLPAMDKAMLRAMGQEEAPSGEADATPVA
jgi:hypothetical protein